MPQKNTHTNKLLNICERYMNICLILYFHVNNILSALSKMERRRVPAVILGLPVILLSQLLLFIKVRLMWMCANLNVHVVLEHSSTWPLKNLDEKSPDSVWSMESAHLYMTALVNARIWLVRMCFLDRRLGQKIRFLARRRLFKTNGRSLQCQAFFLPQESLQDRSGVFLTERKKLLRIFFILLTLFLTN